MEKDNKKMKCKTRNMSACVNEKSDPKSPREETGKQRMKINKHVLSNVILFTHKAINTEPPISTCRFSTLISTHFLTELVERI